MKTKKSQQKTHSMVKDVFKLYQNESIITLFNDLVAIGTWPTPEKPKIKINRTADGTIAIDTVPLPERPKYLKALVLELLAVAGELKIKEAAERK